MNCFPQHLRGGQVNYWEEGAREDLIPNVEDVLLRVRGEGRERSCR